MRHLRPIALLVLTFLLGACASYQTWRPGRPEDAISRVWVDNNLSDNRRVDLMLVAALKARGISAESGAHTLRGPEERYVLIYRDHWNWDFGEHLVGLELELRDVKYRRLVSTAAYSGPAAMTTSAQEAAGRLVEVLLSGQKAPATRR